MVARSRLTASSIDAEAGSSTDGWTLADTLGDDDDRLGMVEEFVTLQPALAMLTERERKIPDSAVLQIDVAERDRARGRHLADACVEAAHPHPRDFA